MQFSGVTWLNCVVSNGQSAGRSGIRSARPTPEAQGEACRSVWAEPATADIKRARRKNVARGMGIVRPSMYGK
jgi:hypothetical protein